MAGKVSLATTDDIPDLIEIFWEAFSGPGEVLFPHSDGGRKWLQRSFDNFLGQKSYYRPESKVAVVRNLNSLDNTLRRIREELLTRENRQTSCACDRTHSSTGPEHRRQGVEDTVVAVRRYTGHE